MKKIMTAALGLSLLSGTAVFAAQNTSTAGTDTMSSSTMKTKKTKKHKKSTSTDSMSTSTTSTTK